MATHVGDTDIRVAGSTDRDIFVAEYAPDSSLAWVTQMVGSGVASGSGRAITTDSTGNVFVGGQFTGAVNFGGNSLTSAGGKDGFAAKVSADGTVLWAQRWGGLDDEYVDGITVDGSGNVLPAGSTIHFNPDGSQAYYNLQVQKFSSAGTALWSQQLGDMNGGDSGAGDVGAQGIAADAAGNVYLCGIFRGTVDFDASSRTNKVNGGANDSGFVLKLTPASGFTWVSPFLATSPGSSSKCFDVAIDGSGNAVVGGSYQGTVDFKPGGGIYTLPPSGIGQGFLVKLSPTNSLVWASSVGPQAVRSLTLDATGNVFAQGLYSYTGDFDPTAGTNTLTNHGGTDICVSKYTSAGTYVWAVGFGGIGYDWSEGIAVTSTGNVSVSGYYFATLDFDPDPNTAHELTSAGNNDAFFVTLTHSDPKTASSLASSSSLASPDVSKSGFARKLFTVFLRSLFQDLSVSESET